MKRYILDGNIFDQILDQKINIALIKSKGDLYITNVQISELKNIPVDNRRNEMLKILSDLNPIKLNLESGIWLDDIYWDDDQPWLDNIGDTCGALYGNSRGTKKWKDALIGEVAKKQSLILVTNDIGFNKRAIKNGIDMILFEDFLKS